MRNAALRAAGSALKKDYEETKNPVAPIKDFHKPGKPSTPRIAPIPLNRLIPLTNLMEAIGPLSLDLPDGADLPPAQWGNPEKDDTITLIHEPDDTVRLAASLRRARWYTDALA
jgi:hypothetical protein